MLVIAELTVVHGLRWGEEGEGLEVWVGGGKGGRGSPGLFWESGRLVFVLLFLEILFFLLCLLV